MTWGDDMTSSGNHVGATCNCNGNTRHKFYSYIHSLGYRTVSGNNSEQMPKKDAYHRHSKYAFGIQHLAEASTHKATIYL